MEFRDLKAQYDALKMQIDQAMLEVVTQGNYIMGKQVIELENRLAEYVGVKHCITCANGTDALTLVLMAWNIKKGDAVFVPNFTFFATGEVVAYEGATPVFVDIDEDTFNMDPQKLEESIEVIRREGQLTPRAIISVDLFGLPADYVQLEVIAKKNNLLLLEDAAQGFGGRIGKRRACSFGDVATTSFFPAKPLGCYGDGGAIFTNDDRLAEIVKSFRVHGKGEHKYDNVRIGMNSRLDTIQAAILIEKLQAFIEYELDEVNRVADMYTQQLEDIVKIPSIPEGYYSSWAQYSIQLESEEQRNLIIKKLKEQGIPSMVYYPKTLNQQDAFKGLEIDGIGLDRSMGMCKKILAVPMHPYLTNEDIKRITTIIRGNIQTKTD